MGGDESLVLTIRDLETGQIYQTTGSRYTRAIFWAEAVERTIEDIQGVDRVPVRLPILIN